MKKSIFLLIPLVMSSPVFSAVPGQIILASLTAVHCDPGSCFIGGGTGHDLTQAVVGYDRQVQRVMRPVNELGAVSEIPSSVQVK